MSQFVIFFDDIEGRMQVYNLGIVFIMDYPNIIVKILIKPIRIRTTENKSLEWHRKDKHNRKATNGKMGGDRTKTIAYVNQKRMEIIGKKNKKHIREVHFWVEESFSPGLFTASS